MDIRAELETAVSIKQGSKEDDYEYSLRLAETVDREATDEIFNALSKEAQEWMNAAARSYKTRKQVPALPGVKTVAVPVKRSEATDSKKPIPEMLTTLSELLNPIPVVPVQEVVSATATAEVISPKEEMVKKNDIIMADLAAELKPKKIKKTKVVRLSDIKETSSPEIREIICQNYNLSLAEIQDILTQRNIPFKASLVRNILAYVGSTIKTLDSLGLLKNSTLKGLSDSAKLRELICSNPTWTVSEIRKAVTEQGINCNKNTISVMFYHIRATKDTLKKLNMID